MKKLFVAVALFMGLGTSVTMANNIGVNTEVTVMVNEYTPVDLKDVPQAIKDAVAKNYANSAIKEAHVKTAEDGTKTYKIILVDAEQTETPVLFSENGEEIVQEEQQ